MSNVIVEHLKTIIMAFWNMKTWSSNGGKVQSCNLQLHKTSPWLVAFFHLFLFCVGWIVFPNQAFKPVTFAFKRIPPPHSQGEAFKCRTNMWETFGSCNRATRLWQKYPNLHWMLPDQAARLPYNGRRQEPLKAAAQIARLEKKKHVQTPKISQTLRSCLHEAAESSLLELHLVQNLERVQATERGGSSVPYNGCAFSCDSRSFISV